MRKKVLTLVIILSCFASLPLVHAEDVVVNGHLSLFPNKKLIFGDGTSLSTAPLDAVSASYYLPKSGGIMDGPLFLPTDGLNVGTAEFVVTGGNVGIGTESPRDQLEITGNLRLPATTTTTGMIKSGDSTLIHSYGGDNFFAGRNAGNLSMTGIYNAASGGYALSSNTTGKDNTASGDSALFSNTEGYENTASGSSALATNTTGNYNTASGGFALHYNTTGSDNTASGDYALFSNTTGSENTASGSLALQSNTEGYDNTAGGVFALFSNTIGVSNTASGSYALYSNTEGYYNTASGDSALTDNTIGNSNTASGSWALGQSTGDFNTAVGDSAGFGLLSGNNNIYIGAYVQTDTVTESDTIRIGNGSTSTYIAGIYGKSSTSGSAVYVNSGGKLGTTLSSRRYKEEIQDMGDATSGLMKLRPVSFFYKPEYADGPRLRQYGLIAEEVAEVYPDLVLYNANGEPDTVYYQFVNAMLLNEVQKQQLKIKGLEERLDRLEALLKRR